MENSDSEEVFSPCTQKYRLVAPEDRPLWFRGAVELLFTLRRTYSQIIKVRINLNRVRINAAVARVFEHPPIHPFFPFTSRTAL